MRGPLSIVGCVLAIALVGCSEDSSPGDSSAESVQPAAADAVDGLPEEMVGTFVQGGDTYFSFYEPGDDFCLSEAGTDGSCYVVRDGADESATPIEYGTVAVENGVLQMTAIEDPKVDCIGATNELRWEKTADGLTLTPIKDCHGMQTVELSRE